MQKRQFYVLMILLCLMTLPWLGATDFNTKGEPREAIVAQTMLEQHNWILPTNNGGELAYKPPFFHWCVALTSLPLGDVNEWTARFPSALAGILLLGWMYIYYARRKDSDTALWAVLICLTSFEVFRALFACRVDMVLTLGIVGAMFAFSAWSERERRGIPWLAILMMSLGTLTKGPVAMLLPCGVTGAYLLLRGENFWKTLFSMIGAGAASLLLPLCWYYAAWQQGGDHFLALVKEENVDRFLGKMTYASHENPWWYNVEMILAGLLPWTLAVLGRWVADKCPHNVQFRGLGSRLRNLDSTTLYSLLAAVIVFVFYCIPKSKRGVYLLPVYPFVAWFIAFYLRDWSIRIKRWVLGIALSAWMIAFALVLPMMLNKRSDIDIAQDIQQMQLDAPLMSHVSGSVPGNPNHYFTINYYMHNTVGVWTDEEIPAQGYLIIGEKDAETFLEVHSSVSFRQIYTSSHKSCDTKQLVRLYVFERKN